VSLLDLVRRRLRVKVIALIVAILVAGFGILVTANIQREAQALVDAHQETARLLAASILGSIESGMLEARPDVIRRLVGDLKSDAASRGPASVTRCSRKQWRRAPRRRATRPSTAAAC
jgi:hypothetical protein